MSDRSPDYLSRNRAEWNRFAAEHVEPGRRGWSGAPTWGIWGIPEAEVALLPELAGRDAVELGCGTAYVSSWLARGGARPVGIDNSPAQLASARTFQSEFDLRFPLVHAAAEALPFADASFDIAISEYGASIWSDPYRWVPEASRVLRSGGDLVFLVNGAILMLCMPDYENETATHQLRRDYFGMHRFEWPDDDSVEFHLGHGEWIRLLRRNGFEVLDLVELRPSEDATSRHSFVTREWARRWPSEEVWKARRR